MLMTWDKDPSTVRKAVLTLAQQLLQKCGVSYEPPVESAAGADTEAGGSRPSSSLHRSGSSGSLTSLNERSGSARSRAQSLGSRRIGRPKSTAFDFDFDAADDTAAPSQETGRKLRRRGSFSAEAPPLPSIPAVVSRSKASKRALGEFDGTKTAPADVLAAGLRDAMSMSGPGHLNPVDCPRRTPCTVCALSFSTASAVQRVISLCRRCRLVDARC